MTRMKSLFNMLGVFAVCLMCSTFAQAQATRTWVSGVGDDVNPCSRTAPCKTFAGAISKTAAGGEINVLDPGGFGAVTITKSMTIDGGGFIAGIVTTTSGIIVNAGVNDKVTLRNLNINGLNTAGNLSGIRFLAGKQLNVENCKIYEFGGNGIDVALGGSANVFVKDTNIINCAVSAVKLSTTTGFLSGSIDNVRMEACTNGVDVVNTAGGSCFAMVRNSSIVGNSGNGVICEGGAAVADLENVMLAFNGNGVNAAANLSIIRISNTNIYNNTNGIVIAAGGTVKTSVNNRIDGNATDGAPNATKVQQ
ncbi:MAG TPA: right-handed parallel beta-helix repeat-containing protein [Blastocatellia bacterium]|nr:right-handed parallel beta-helix repeat-containing protein [Blastocatellia bacterium]